MHKVTALTAAIFGCAWLMIFGLQQATATDRSGDGSPKGTLASNANQQNVVRVPIDVQIATGAAGDESLDHGVYLFHVKCSADRSCMLQRIVLNECSRSANGGDDFAARADTWGTTLGSLAVKHESSTSIEFIVFQALGSKVPATVKLGFEHRESPISRLTAFAATDFIDLRSWPKITNRVNYEPVPTDRTKMMNCAVRLPGLMP